MDKFLQAAIDEAKKGLAEGGIPIGSVLVIDNKIVSKDHNRRVKKAVQFCTQRWTAWKMQVALNPQIIEEQHFILHYLPVICAVVLFCFMVYLK